MGLISRLFNFASGTPIVADDVDAEFDQIIALLNGELDGANIDTASIAAFLKLFTSGDHKVKWGSHDNGGASWGLTPDRVFNIPHGLGSAPAWWIAWGARAVSTASSEDPTVVTRISDDATNLRVKQSTLYRGNCNFPGATVFWLAIT